MYYDQNIRFIDIMAVFGVGYTRNENNSIFARYRGKINV